MKVIKTPLAFVFFAALGIIALGWLILGQSRPADTDTDRSGDQKDIVVFCAAGVKQPVEAVAEAFSEETGESVVFQFGGTGSLLSQLRVSGGADLFIGADADSIRKAKDFGLTREELPFAIQTPVIAVSKGNPKGIDSLDDLFRPDVRFAMTNPETASIGKATRRAFGRDWERAVKASTVMKTTVTESASDLSVGAIDAAILWDATANQFGFDTVRVPELDALAEPVTAAVTADAKKPAAALRFARYLAAPAKGSAILSPAGLVPQPGDQWATRPEIIVYSGSVNRPAVEGLFRQFSAREGVDISTVFNGCGILCAAMVSMKDSANPKFPDLYYACDVCFVPPVADDFPEVYMMTSTRIGIVVPKGNPKNIRTLEDLTRTGLRLGLCNAQQSTLGYMTDGILTDSGLSESIRSNAVSEVPTADLLINQLRAGSLDAAIVYEINYQHQAEHLEFSVIEHPGAKAVQPVGVWAKSPNTQTATRLMEFLMANEETFVEAGFVWEGAKTMVRSDEIELPPWLKPIGTGIDSVLD